MNRLLILPLTAALAGCGHGDGPSGSTQRQGPAADPGMRASLAVIALEREEEHAVSAEQAAKILPWLRVLAEMRPEDVEAAQAIADEVFAVLTAEQRAALEEIRERAADRRPPGGPGGPPGGGSGVRRGPGVGQGAPAGQGGQPEPERRAEFRRRAIERAIRLLEAKIPATSP
ncbi:MAG TPA: hypothetical protein VGR25_04255 [bacterium]|nr:hypothetical protein [bacterium]